MPALHRYFGTPGTTWVLNGCAEVAMQCRHRLWFDVAAESRAHDVLGPLAKLLDKRFDFAEVVGAIRVSHDDVLAADVRDGVDIGPAQAALGGFKTRAPPMRARPTV